ncbi:hypothetical protein [Clostridium sp. YIM B02551]|uniref:hypothetical protein n=1 Tax=Clostridium sp. YIM B02551 TaxID=2910679 RepID=UPI001EE9F7E0|nr:hypothetical protein [Clostridium sp. YIM B02551]
MKQDVLDDLLEFVLGVNGMSLEDMVDFLRKKENLYMLILIMKDYHFLHDKRVKEILGEHNKNINSTLKKAEEKILINSSFRERYFRIDEKIKKII